MEHWLQQIINWLPDGGAYLCLLFLIAFCESLVGGGLVLPGSTLCVLAGFLSLQGKGNILSIMSVTGAGAFLGDFFSYWLGARFGSPLMNTTFFRKHIDLLRKAEIFFSTRGGSAVFIGRFFGPLRGFIPFVAGGARMSPASFASYALVSSMLWGLAYPGLGYLGGASWQRVQQLTGRLSLLILILVALFFLNIIFWNKVVPRLALMGPRIHLGLHRLADQLLDSAPLKALARSFPGTWNFIHMRFSPRSGSGLYLTVGLILSSGFSSLFIWTSRSLRLEQADVLIYQEMAQLRHPWSDAVFLGLTYMASVPVICLIGIVVLLGLILKNRDFSALILLAGTAGGELLMWLLKFFFDRPRPSGFFPSLQVYGPSFPSGHSFVALIFYGLVTYMLLDHVNRWRHRAALVLGTSFFALLIGLSRVYLGVHWFSDVLGGFALAAVWLTFLIIASEVRRRYGGEFPWNPGRRLVHLSEGTRKGIMTFACTTAGLILILFVHSRVTHILGSSF